MSMSYVKGRRLVTDFTGDKGFTVQADAESADINKIIARFEKGGSLARMNAKEPFYGDVSDLGGLADCLIKVQKADELFMDLDAKVRERFENDPVQLIDFLEDPNNLKEAIDLGIVSPRPEPVVEPPVVVPEPVVPVVRA